MEHVKSLKKAEYIKKYIILSFLFLNAVFSAFPSDVPGILKVSMVFAFDRLPGEDKYQYLDMLENTLSASVKEAGFIPVIKDNRTVQAGESAVSLFAAVDSAREAGAHLAVTGYLAFDEKRIFVQIKVFDPGTGEVIGSGSGSGSLGLTSFNVIKDAVDSVMTVISGFRETFLQRTEIENRRINSISFKSEEQDMDIVIPGKVVIGTIRGSEAYANMRDHGYFIGDSLFIEKQKEDSIPKQ